MYKLWGVWIQQVPDILQMEFIKCNMIQINCYKSTTKYSLKSNCEFSYHMWRFTAKGTLSWLPLVSGLQILEANQ